MATQKKSFTANPIPEPTKAKTTTTSTVAPKQKVDLIFGKRNFMFLLIGVGLIILGMFLMSGGHMPNDNTWDDSLIYSARRTVLAPIVILAGLGIQVYTIFTNKGE